MKLEKYLADYIEHEISNDERTLQQVIKQGLDAFESTENVKIEIIDNPLDTIMENALDEPDKLQP